MNWYNNLEEESEYSLSPVYMYLFTLYGHHQGNTFITMDGYMFHVDSWDYHINKCILCYIIKDTNVMVPWSDVEHMVMTGESVGNLPHFCLPSNYQLHIIKSIW